MALDPGTALWFLLAAGPIALWVAWSDMATMRIPNLAVIALCGVYLVLGPWLLPLADWGWGWAGLAVVLAIGFVLNAAGAVGAGDAKFAAAMAPFVAPGDLPLFLPLFAAVMLAAFAAHRLARMVPALRGMAPHWRSWSARDFPMGLALGAGLVIYLALAAFGPGIAAVRP